jgi:radical SAM superfamily enzyme YgiQ (UPF0313 family)
MEKTLEIHQMKTVLLGANYSIIEPTGLFPLSTVAIQEGWNPKIILGRDPDFKEIEKAVDEIQPDLFGFTVYTGNHLEASKLFKNLKSRHQNIKIAVGGPHPTYFPKECSEYADYVVVGEGYDNFRKILRGEATPGILHFKKQETPPTPYRKSFYESSPFHKKNPIKNVMITTGCPHSCTYCYNSSTLNEIKNSLTNVQIKEMQNALKKDQKLFLRSERSVHDVLNEIDELQLIAPETKMIYFQDDNFGLNINWLKEFLKKYNKRYPFHVNMRFELANPKNDTCRQRIEMMREAGATGITFAIESYNPIIRKEILNRPMSQELIRDSMLYLGKLGYKVRTFSILGLPLGATSIETEINLEADLKNLEFNVNLKKETGLPTVAWASTLAPYRGTKMGKYCSDHGFYSGDNSDIPKDSYRIRSVLNFPKKWIGEHLNKNTPEHWMDSVEQEDYKDKLESLMHMFSTFALMPKGHIMAKNFLDNTILKSSETRNFLFNYSQKVRYHMYDQDLYKI